MIPYSLTRIHMALQELDRIEADIRATSGKEPSEWHKQLVEQIAERMDH